MGISSSDDDAQAGAVSQPQDLQDDGPVTLEDRTEPGGQGSPDTNQGRAEQTVPATTEHPSPAKAETSSLDEMNVGSADPQAPRHPAAAGSGLAVDGVAAGMAPTGLSGPELPVQDAAGVAHRAPGLQGTTPPGEAVESDVQAGALRMGPNAPDTTDAGRGHGDAATVPTSGSEAADGTSEEHGVVHGIRLPEASEVPQD